MSSDERKRRRKILFIIDLAVSLLVSLFINTALNDRMSLNPVRWIVDSFVYGFPFGIFVLVFGIFIGLILYIEYKQSQELERDDRDFLYSKSGTYGTAKLLKHSDDIAGVARIQDAAHACGTILGQMDMSGKRIINQDIFDKHNHRNKHIIVFGASSSGKTYSFVKPFCIQAVRRRESVVITDPKGELYEDTSEYFRSRGYVVRRFDMKNLALSDGWDILAEIRDDPDRAAILASVIWANLSDGEDSDGVFSAGPTSLLKALLLRVGLDDEMKKNGTQNISMVYEMLQNPEGEAYLESMFSAQSLNSKTRVSRKAYMSFKQASPNLRGSILTGLSARLEVLQSDLVCKVLSTPDIDLTLPGKVPCAYFCILPDMHSTYNFVAATFFSFLFNDLVDYADSLPDRRCKVPVNFLLDEFANIGSIPEFDKKLATVRSRALNISIVLQDLPQLMYRYPKTGKSILSNCATYLCIGCNDPDTAQFFSDRAGEATIQVRTDQHEKMEAALTFGHRHSTGEGKRKIFTPDELMTFDMDECLIVWQALYAMKAYKYPYKAHPEANQMKPISIADYPKISDEEGRKKLREEEAERIAKFNDALKHGYDPLAHFGGVTVDMSDEEIKQCTEVDWFNKIRQEWETIKHYARLFVKRVKHMMADIEYRTRRDKMTEAGILPEATGTMEDNAEEMFDIAYSAVEDVTFQTENAGNEPENAPTADTVSVAADTLFPESMEGETEEKVPDHIIPIEHSDEESKDGIISSKAAEKVVDCHLQRDISPNPEQVDALDGVCSSHCKDQTEPNHIETPKAEPQRQNNNPNIAMNSSSHAHATNSQPISDPVSPAPKSDMPMPKSVQAQNDARTKVNPFAGFEEKAQSDQVVKDGDHSSFDNNNPLTPEMQKQLSDLLPIGTVSALDTAIMNAILGPVTSNEDLASRKKFMINHVQKNLKELLFS